LREVSGEVLTRIYKTFDPTKAEGTAHVQTLLKKYPNKLPALLARLSLKHGLPLRTTTVLVKHVRARIDDKHRKTSQVCPIRKSRPTPRSCEKKKGSLSRRSERPL
jgi:hypothetical protein